MRVAIVQQRVDVRRGGAETSTIEMARCLAQTGLDVTIVCQPPHPHTDDDLVFLPVAVPRWPRTMQAVRFVRGADRLCQEGGFDIVHAITPCLAANVYQPRGGTYAQTIKRGLALTSSPVLRGVKRIGRLFNSRQQYLNRLEHTLLTRHRNRVTVAALSDYVRRQVESGLAFPPERIRVVFNGVDVAPLSDEERARHRADLRARLQLDAGTPLVLFAAHNFKLKGLAELIRAAAIDPASHSANPWTLAVAGRDNPRPYERLARRLGVAERVQFRGTSVPIRAWYAAADALAHPTWHDPCSRVVLESLCLGLPAVTTRYNGAAEVIEPDRHGEVVEGPGDIRGLAAAIDRVLQPAVRKACLADASRFREQFSMARHAEQLALLYEEILADSAPGGV